MKKIMETQHPRHSTGSIYVRSRLWSRNTSDMMVSRLLDVVYIQLILDTQLINLGMLRLHKLSAWQHNSCSTNKSAHVQIRQPSIVINYKNSLVHEPYCNASLLPRQNWQDSSTLRIQRLCLFSSLLQIVRGVWSFTWTWRTWSHLQVWQGCWHRPEGWWEDNRHYNPQDCKRPQSGNLAMLPRLCQSLQWRQTRNRKKPHNFPTTCQDNGAVEPWKPRSQG